MPARRNLRDSYSYSYSDADADAHSNADANSDANSYSYSYSDANANANANANADANADATVDADDDLPARSDDAERGVLPAESAAATGWLLRLPAGVPVARKRPVLPAGVHGAKRPVRAAAADDKCAPVCAAATADNLPVGLDAARRQLRGDRSRPAAAAGHWPGRLRAAAVVQRPGLPRAGRLRAAVVRRPGLPPAASLWTNDAGQRRVRLRSGEAVAHAFVPWPPLAVNTRNSRSPQEIVSKLDLIESPEGNL
jgi:hypothetical protein